MCTRWIRYRGRLRAINTSSLPEISKVTERRPGCGTKSARRRNRSSGDCSLTQLREWLAILSLNGACLHTTTQLLTLPRKTNCLTDALISELKYKTGRVIFKLRRQLWQLEQQLRGDASNLSSMPFQLLGTYSLLEVDIPGWRPLWEAGLRWATRDHGFHFSMAK